MTPASTIRTALLALAFSATAAEAQRCTLTPSYAPLRVSGGYSGSSYSSGGGHGGVLRVVRNSFAIEGRAEYVDAAWMVATRRAQGGLQTLEATPWPIMMEPARAVPVAGATGGVTLRHSRPLGDGLAALCYVIDHNSSVLNGEREGFAHRELGLGVGVAVPMRIKHGTAGSVLIEARAVRHHVGHADGLNFDWLYGPKSFGAELTLGGAIELPGNTTLGIATLMSIYDRQSSHAPRWRPYSAPALRLTVMRHLDIR